MKKPTSTQRFDEAPKLDSCLGSGTVAVIALRSPSGAPPLLVAAPRMRAPAVGDAALIRLTARRVTVVPDGLDGHNPQSSDGIQQLHTVTKRGDAKLLQVLVRQARENRLVYVILAEDRLIPSEAKAPQPDHNVHDGHPNSGLPHIIALPGEGVQDRLLENGRTAVMLWTRPDLSHGLVEVSSLATRVKNMAGVLTEMLIGVLAVIWLIRSGVRHHA